MRLGDIDGNLFSRAVAIYLRLAYKEGAIPISISSQLDWIHHWGDLANPWSERYLEVCEGQSGNRYYLRLGSWVYPHMKLGVVECQGGSGEFVFIADTHDRHFELDPNTPDYDQFQKVKRLNEMLKTRIEKAWAMENIPTESTLHQGAEKSLMLRPISEGSDYVLIVDDTPTTLAVESAILERNGFNPVACDSGAGAVEAVKKYNFDACVLDIMMPDLDGYDVVDRLEELGLRTFPIAFSSAMMPFQVKMDKVDGFIQKPFRPQYFIEQVKELIGNGQHALLQ